MNFRNLWFIPLFICYFSFCTMPAHAKSPSTSLPNQNMPAFTMTVIAKRPGKLLAIYGLLSRPVDAETLGSYGRKCFEEAEGKAYKEVHINWYLRENTQRGKPWGVTNYTQTGLVYIEIYGP